jgi:PmbA protein
LEMYRNLTLANDLEYIYSTNSPTIMINQMTVAGK